jgi:Flp pilus assembly protein TadG
VNGDLRVRAERGSMTVEFVILAPLLLVLMLFIVLAGRVVEAHGEVDGAARDAARAASVALSPAGAAQAADQAVADDVNGWCSNPEVQGFVPGSNTVTVTLKCHLDLSFIGGGKIPISGYGIAPLDQYVARQF